MIRFRAKSFIPVTLAVVASFSFVGCSGDDASMRQFAAGEASNDDGSIAAGGNAGHDNWPTDDETAQDEGSNDKYEDVGTNPFVDAAHDPFSTFAADVDTASYDIFVRDIEAGSLPQPQSVRLEEFVNFFAYDYPQGEPGADVPFTVSIDATPHVLARETSLIRVGIQGKAAPPSEKREANLVFLIDTSGSMSGAAKLPLVQSLLTYTLDELDPTDSIAIVTYAGSTGVALESTPASEREKIASAIGKFQAGGSTAGGAGITLAYEQAQGAFVEGGINHVILCTDGDFNVGLSSDQALVNLIEEKRKTGITLTVLGFGSGNLNDSMMEKLTNAGNGTYSVITSERHAKDYAENDLFSSLVYIAKDMKIQVEFNALLVEAYRLLGYENRAIADDDFRDDAVDAGEVGSGHRVTALYEVVLTGAPVPSPEGAPKYDTGEPVEGEREIGEGEFVRVKVRYKDVDASESDAAHEVTKSLVADGFHGLWEDAGEDLKWAGAIAGFAEILKASPFASLDDLERIQTIVSAQAGRDVERGNFADHFVTAKGLLTR